MAVVGKNNCFRQRTFIQLSSGTTKGMLLYILVVASLQNGLDLIVDEM